MRIVIVYVLIMEWLVDIVIVLGYNENRVGLYSTCSYAFLSTYGAILVLDSLLKSLLDLVMWYSLLLKTSTRNRECENNFVHSKRKPRQVSSTLHSNHHLCVKYNLH
jgi:hypothetical protein